MNDELLLKRLVEAFEKIASAQMIQAEASVKSLNNQEEMIANQRQMAASSAMLERKLAGDD